MVTFKVIITIWNILVLMLMFMFQRNQTDRVAAIGFWVLILLHITNTVLIWN